ncbi:hypothetical protein C7S13_2823 [Burkholderia cepacia]|nr:hypothetical protein [Burkholderia cepacia]
MAHGCRLFNLSKQVAIRSDSGVAIGVQLIFRFLKGRSGSYI